METESPRALEKREGRKVHCGGHSGLTQKRPILQANRAMKARLGTLLFCRRWGVQQ